MEQLMQLIHNKDFLMAVLGVLLAISELLPFLNVKPNGIMEAALKLLKDLGKKK